MGHRELGSWSTKAEGRQAFVLTSLVTFLNKTLKDFDLIFGLTKNKDQLTVKIYRVERTEIDGD